MTDVEICGAETTGEEPCQNPAGDDGRCWIPSHNDPDAENPDGRPSKFTEDRAQDALEAARIGKSEAGCARAAGVAHTTIQRWRESDVTLESGEEFRAAFRRARSQGEDRLLEGGLEDEGVDTSMAKFLLSTSFGYVKTEKREHEHSGPDGNPIEVTVNRERYEPDE